MRTEGERRGEEQRVGRTRDATGEVRDAGGEREREKSKGGTLQKKSKEI